jgi:hypothetical protein
MEQPLKLLHYIVKVWFHVENQKEKIDLIPLGYSLSNTVVTLREQIIVADDTT